MSRCFPFPPPGYERKTKPDDFDAVKEEKHKEKKHKKDKENREGKEKRDKDRSQGKHKEKRDRKEKHKDKKDKHRDNKKDEEEWGKDREKSSISEESKVAGNGERVSLIEQNKDRSCSLDEAKHAAQFQVQNGGKPIQNNLISEELKESKFVRDLDSRIKNEGKGSSNQLLERVSGAYERNQNAERSAARDSSGALAEDKGKNTDKRVDRKMDVQIQNLAEMAKVKVGGMPRLVEEHTDQRLEGKEKSKDKGYDKQGENWKENDRDKNSHRTDKEKEKEKEKKKEKDKEKKKKKKKKKKMEKDKEKKKEKDKKRKKEAKEKSEHKKIEQDRSKDQKNEFIGFASNGSTPLLVDFNSSAVNEGNIRKRKDCNGFIHESNLRPNKLLKPAPHQLTENGRKLEVFCTPNLFIPDKQGVPDNVQLEKKDQRVNGIIEAQKLSDHKTKPFTATVVTDQISEASRKPPHIDKCTHKVIAVPKVEDQFAEASRKPPHPDSKYLSEVLAVPKMEEWSEFYDQEWLFSRKYPPSEKHEVGSLQINQERCVWSEAMHVESDDVYALPYVIPY